MMKPMTSGMITAAPGIRNNHVLEEAALLSPKPEIEDRMIKYISQVTKLRILASPQNFSYYGEIF